MKTTEINTEQIWNSFGNELYHFIQARVKNKDVSKDILQDVFIKIHLQLHTLKNKNSLTPWLYQITRNLINNYFRSQRLFTDIDNLEIPNPYKSRMPDKFIKCMSAFIQQLPKKYKQAVMMVDIRNMDQVSLSKELNISYSGAKSRLQRARRLLRTYIEACCEIVSDKYGNIVSHQPKGNCLCAA